MRILIRKPELAYIREKLNPRREKASLNSILIFFCIILMLGSGILACMEAVALPRENPAKLSRTVGTLESAALSKSRFTGSVVKLVLRLPSGDREVFRVHRDALPMPPEELKAELDRQNGRQMELLYYSTVLNDPQIRELRCGETIWFSATESCALAKEAVHGQLVRSGIVWLLCIGLIPCALGILRFRIKSGKVYPDDLFFEPRRTSGRR